MCLHIKYLNLHVHACHLIYLPESEHVCVFVCVRACVCTCVCVMCKVRVYKRECALMRANVCVCAYISVFVFFIFVHMNSER